MSVSFVNVHYMPTSDEAARAMLLLANVTESDVVCDLGCGDGRILITAARLFGSRGIGADIDPERVREARENARKAGVDHLVRIEERDLFEVDISEATVVTLFMLSNVNVMLRPKLLSELRPGARIVSNTFNMGVWQHEREMTVGEVEDEHHHVSHKLYLWTVPAQDAL